MKKLLFIFAVLAFTNFSYAQQVNSLKDAAKATESISKTSSKEVQKQIQNGLVTNDELSSMGAKYLQNNPETRSTFSKIYKENKGSIGQVMKAAMSNPKLSSSVMDWINGNPDVMNKALGMLGM